MAQAQKARKLEIELPAINAETMDKVDLDMAREAGAVIKCKSISLMDTIIFEEYLGSFRIENN